MNKKKTSNHKNINPKRFTLLPRTNQQLQKIVSPKQSRKKIFQSEAMDQSKILAQPKCELKSPQRFILKNSLFEQFPNKERKQLPNSIFSGRSTQHPLTINQNNIRLQRNTEKKIDDYSQRDSVRSKESRQSEQSSLQKIKITANSLDHRLEKSYSRSDQSSTSRRKGGIELTKTLLKKISGMYSDRDFQNSFYSTKSKKQQTTGMNMSGQKVNDQYQLSDFDLLNAQNINQTYSLSISNNPLSFNDSGNWKESSNNINIIQSVSREKRSSFLQNDLKMKPQRKNMMMQGNSYEQSATYELYAQNNNPIRVIYDQKPSEKKTLPKVKSYDLLSLKPTSASIIVEPSPKTNFQPKYNQPLIHQPPNQPFTHQTPNQCQQSYEGQYSSNSYNNNNFSQQERYQNTFLKDQIRQNNRRGQSNCNKIPRQIVSNGFLIQSKNRTLQQISLKQSMVFGFDNYYI